MKRLSNKVTDERRKPSAEKKKHSLVRLLATLRAQAAKIEADIELYRLTQARELELSYSKLVSDLEIEKAKRLAEIEITEFKEHVNAIGPKTIQAIATAGPDNQVKLLQSLGIKSTLITDGRSPINLFNTAVGPDRIVNGQQQLERPVR